jgi:CDP-glycerol glycerophosphotransferase (TagB/SpsB family)
VKIKTVVKSIKYWLQACLLPLYWLSFLVPRNKKIWVFGSSFGKRFADNPKYLYLYLSQYKRSETRAIWITKEKEVVSLLKQNGLEVHHNRSLKGFFYCLISGVYIYDNYSKDISFWLSGGAKKVNLWHGSGNKKTNYDNKFDRVRHPRNNWERFKTALRRMSDEKPHHYTLATSPMMADIFTSAFNTDLKHIIIEGYPRNDILFDTKIRNIYSKVEEYSLRYIKEYRADLKKIVLYMPTFRESETLFFKVMNLNAFNEFLAVNNLMFFTKLHPKSKLREDFQKVEYSNIKNIDASMDPYTVLEYADLLVTDYSSIYSDYLMLNRPSVLFPYDFEEYSADTRECYFEYDAYMPEIKAYNMEQLMEYMVTVLEKDGYEEGRLELRDRIFSTVDGNASERLYLKIRAILQP